MTLRTELERQGVWLFRWRSYPPVLLLVLSALYVAWAGFSAQSAAVAVGWQALALLLGLAGLGVRVKTVGHTPRGTSGRNVHRQVAEVLNSTGMYSIVRHPLYVGNALMWLAVAAFTRSVWVLLGAGLVFWIYYERIMFAEEAFLARKFGEPYVEWASRTPAFLPAFRNWRPPALPFSLRTVLRREYSGLLGMTASWALLDAIGNWHDGKGFTLDPFWLAVLVVSALAYIVLRTLKRHTRRLNVEGR